MNRKQQIFEAVLSHILKEYYELNEQPLTNTQALLNSGDNGSSQKSDVGNLKSSANDWRRFINIPGQDIKQAFLDTSIQQDSNIAPEQSADDKVKAMLDKFRGDRAAFQKAQQDVITGKTKIKNFPGSVLRVGENMSQLSMKQGEASKALAGLPPPMMKSGRGGASSLPNAATYGVPGAEVVYNPNRINSPTALMALRNNAAKAAARLKAQEAGAASAPPPASNTGAGSSTAPPASGQTPPPGQSPSTTPPPANQQLPPESSVRMPRNVA